MRKPRKPPDQVLAHPSLFVDEDVIYTSKLSFGLTFDEVMLKHAAGKLRNVHIARFLAATAVLHQKHAHVPVPREIVEIIGERLTSREQFFKEKNRKRAKKAQLSKDEAARVAAAYRRKKPGATSSEIARHTGISRRKIPPK